MTEGLVEGQEEGTIEIEEVADHTSLQAG